MALIAFPISEDPGDPNANPPRPAVTCQSLLSDGKTYYSNLARWRAEKEEATAGDSSKWTWLYCDPHVQAKLGNAPTAQTIPALPPPPAPPAPTVAAPATPPAVTPTG